MFNSNNGASLSDIAALMNNNDGIGGNGGWWILIILLALFGGFGGNRCGMFGGNGTAATASGVTDGYILTSDFATLERKADSINNGLCDGFFALTNTVNSGINSVNTNVMQLSSNVQQGIADIRYNMATDTCAIKTAINQAAQDIMQNCNANYRQLHDEQVATQMAAMQTQINDFRQRELVAQLAASQATQTNELKDWYSAKNPCPIPSYIVPNPNAYVGCCGQTYGGCCA